MVRKLGIDEKLYDEKAAKESFISKSNKEIKDAQYKIPEITREIEQLSDQLKQYASIKNKQEKREDLSKRLESIENDHDSFKVKKKKFIRNYMIYLSLYPYAKRTVEEIKDKQLKGKLPPSIDKQQIENIINNHIKNCPVCDGEINEHAMQHIRSVLEKLEVSASTSNYLMEIKGSLESLIKNAENYENERNELIQSEKYYLKTKKELEEQLDDLSAFFANHETRDISNIENDYQNKITEKNNLENIINNQQGLIDIYQARLNEINETIKKYEDQQKAFNALREQVRVFRSLAGYLEKIIDNIMNEIKEEITEKTWEYFSNMIWKKDTFKKITIDDSYSLKVFNINDNEMTGSMSATETMALAYAFTMAIHEVSGQNCPLVVDSPLGRVSDENRINMAKELLKISKQKQIIMLFTPDEYSQEVKEIYSDNVSSNRFIKLSDNEQEIEGVKTINE